MRNRPPRFTLILMLLVVLMPLTMIPMAGSVEDEEATGYGFRLDKDIFLVRPKSQYVNPELVPAEYLSIEDLTILTCLGDVEGELFRTSLICREKNSFVDLVSHKFGPESCFVSSFPLDNFDCERVAIQSEYVENDENFKIIKDIKVNKLSTTLDRIVLTQFDDGGWENPLDTAYGIYVLSYFKDVFEEEIGKALDYLKLQRDEEEKCWPKYDCIISYTANVIAMLRLSELDESLRIIHDGEIYLGSKQTVIDANSVWDVEVQNFPTNVLEAQCSFDYGTDDEIFTVEFNTTKTKSVVPGYGGNISVICSENVIVDITTQDNQHLIHFEGPQFHYEIPDPCWTVFDRGLLCDYRSTGFGLMTGVDNAKKLAAIDTIKGDLKAARDKSMKLGRDGDYTNSALYVYNALDGITRGQVIDYLIFEQNNEGGWFTNDYYYRMNSNLTTYYEPSPDEILYTQHEITDNYSASIFSTGWIVLSLLKAGYDENHEVIEDAEAWVSKHESTIGDELSVEEQSDAATVLSYEINKSEILNATKRNAMAFTVLKNNARPMLKTNPRVLVIEGESEYLQVINPTTFHLDEVTYDLTNGLDEYLKVEEKDFVKPYSFRRVEVSLLKEVDKDSFGYLIISNLDDPTAKVPVILQQSPFINFSAPVEYNVFGTSIQVDFQVEKTAHTFDCTLIWDQFDISSKDSFIIKEGGKLSVPVSFDAAETLDEDYSGVWSCNYESTRFNVPFKIRFHRFSTKPFRVGETVITVDEARKDAYLLLTNVLDQAIQVGVSFEKQNPNFEFSETDMTLFPGETRNITIFNKVIPGGNATDANRVFVSAYGITDEVMFITDIQPPPGTNWTMVILLGAAIAISIGGAAFLVFKNKDELLKSYANMKSGVSPMEEMRQKIHEYERMEEAIAIQNMSAILKLKGLEDKEVRTQLLEEGFSEDELDGALQVKEDEIEEHLGEKKEGEEGEDGDGEKKEGEEGEEKEGEEKKEDKK